MLVIVGVHARHRADQVLVVGAFDLVGGEELPHGSGDARRGVGGALLFAHDDVLPFVEQGVGPQHRVDAVLAERQEQVHDRERKQDVGVRKDRSHGGSRSVRQVGVVDDRCDPLPPGTATFTAHLELDHVGEADAAMTTPG